MARGYIEADRDQLYLMPPSVRDWLPENDLAWFVVDATSQMDLSPFSAGRREDGAGRPAHEPEVMVPLLLYAYCLGERSSRVIERQCRQVDGRERRQVGGLVRRRVVAADCWLCVLG